MVIEKQAAQDHPEIHMREPVMPATVLLIALAMGQPQPEKPVTEAEKQEFLKLLATLPSKGEFYTDEAVKKAVPHTRVLLALTEKDVGKGDLYPFLALSSGLAGHKEARQYATANFGKIAHPTMKLFWALLLFKGDEPPTEVVAFLRKALDSKEDERTISRMLGPGFEDFREGVIRASEKGKLMKVELVKSHSIQAFPAYGGGFDYTNSTYIFAPGPLIYAVRPHEQRGQLITYDIAKGTTRLQAVPQPEGFKPEYDFSDYFGDAVLSINSRGDLFCRWAIEGNGDHGLALLQKGADSFSVKRLKPRLAIQYDSQVVAAPDGGWYLIHWEGGSDFAVYRIDKELNLTRLGSVRRRQSSHLLDARFISNEVLHLFSQASDKVQGSLRCADFDVKQKKWLHNREMLKVDQPARTTGGTVLQTTDGSLHYVWGIQDPTRLEPEQAKDGKLAGVYYQAEAEGTTVRVSAGEHYRAIAVGDRIVICYTLKSAPNSVYFRVIRNGTLGPVTEITAAKGREHNLWSEYMALYAEGDRIWFVNTIAPNTLYELRLVDVTKQ
jgi:hypothetical protein